MRYSSHKTFYAYSEYDGFSVIENQKQRLKQAITSQPDDYILNVNKKEYIDHLISDFYISPIELHEDQLSASNYEKQIPAEHHPHSYHVRSGQTYPKDVKHTTFPLQAIQSS